MTLTYLRTPKVQSQVRWLLPRFKHFPLKQDSGKQHDSYGAPF